MVMKVNSENKKVEERKRSSEECGESWMNGVLE